MKKFLIILLCVSLPLVSIAQPSSVRKVFRKYGHKDGVVKICLPGVVMGFAALFVDDKETAKMLRGVNSIKILTAGEAAGFQDVNFVDEFLDNFRSRSFEELLTVKDGKDDVAIYMKEGKRNKKELLIVAGGPNDNTIIYLKGKVSAEMLSSLGEEMKVDILKSVTQ
ncbi:MAG: DUF4252 domain-containing protein [Bacteroidota bacterium]|nr:DUF4252 domain-containing protein [Bacteroidota bacterium]